MFSLMNPKEFVERRSCLEGVWKLEASATFDQYIGHLVEVEGVTLQVLKGVEILSLEIKRYAAIMFLC